MADFFDQAVQLHLDGFMPLPLKPDGSKAPAVKSWSAYQQQRPEWDSSEFENLFKVDHDGIGVLTGPISGQLELFELEGRAVTEGVLNHLAAAMADAGLGDLWHTVSTGWVELTPSGGVHYHYRVDGEAARNTKLAWRPATGLELAAQPRQSRYVLIETRGRGGFTVLAPSAGRSHPTGAAWRLLAGGPRTTPVISVEQRDALYAIAQTLDQSPAVDTQMPPGTTASTGEEVGGRPGDQFADQATWHDILVPHGWQLTRTFASGHHGWTRPGKRPADGISATTGATLAKDGQDRLYVFSTSAAPFNTEEPYSKFGAWALLNCGGDHAEAARALRRAGFGAPRDPLQQLDGLVDPDTPRTPPEPAHTPPQAARPALQVIDGGRQVTAPVDGATALQPDPVTAIAMVGVDQTEDALARSLVAAFAGELRYCPQRGQWLVWTGSRWAWDEGEQHYERAKQLARGLPRDDGWKVFRRRALSAAGIAGVVRLARTDPQVTVHIDDLDNQPWQLNTPGGIIDMRTGQLQPPDRTALHTRTTSVTPDYAMPSPVWDRFLHETFGGDQELARFVQRLIGLSAVGQVLEQYLPFAIGAGANGKTTLFEVVMTILGRGAGGYSMAAQSEMLMVRRHSEHPAELAQLVGARLVACEEIDDGQRFAEARVKQLTGAGSINARFMRGNPFTFTPSHTLWLVGNNRPNATVGGPAFWRRILLIPFNNVVPPDQRDPALVDKLVAEAPAILAWVAQGAASYNAGGLQVPETVRAATGAYEAEQDTIAGFVDECCHLAAGSDLVQVKASTLRTAYERWCADFGGAPASAKRLSLELQGRFGVTTGQGSRGVRFYRGIALLDDDQSAPPAGEPSAEPESEPWWDR